MEWVGHVASMEETRKIKNFVDKLKERELLEYNIKLDLKKHGGG